LLETRLFLGWFGPRGLASILFALLVSQELEGPAAATILDITVWTVLISVFAHGLSASPWAGRLGVRLADRHHTAAEHGEMPDLPTRRDVP
jgi:sodium/hydrogen antiporter